MSGTALALALGAAVLHALWNLLLARAADPRAATAAYRRGDLSVIYPVARGVAPVLILLAGLAGLGGAVGAAQVAGVVVVGLGIVAVQRGGGPVAPAALGLALATSAAIASYTVVDRSGLDHADPLPYLWLVLAPSALLTIALTARERGAAAVRAALGPATVVAGVATFGAYALVLAALTRAPAAPVAAVRETSIVLAVAAGALILREPVAALRWAGAVAVTAGVALVAAG